MWSDIEEWERRRSAAGCVICSSGGPLDIIAELGLLVNSLNPPDLTEPDPGDALAPRLAAALEVENPPPVAESMMRANAMLSRYLDAALLVPHMPVENLANSMFFIEAESAGRMQIDQALQLRPTLVIGLDFLFWFCYGEGSTDHERLQRFERGLNLLENIKCPLVLGDIPDASSAANGMLGPEEIPSARAMTAANQRLKEWASKRPRVALLPLSAFMRTVMADQALTIHGRKLPAGQTRLLLQDDVLHPSPHGCAVLALAILDAFQSTHPVPTSGEVCWDLEEVFRLGVHPRRELSGDKAQPMTPAA